MGDAQEHAVAATDYQGDDARRVSGWFGWGYSCAMFQDGAWASFPRASVWGVWH
jgi:hypothetical protein